MVESGYDVERGNYVVIDHGDGLSTLYGQCRDFTVEEGDTVRAGEMIGAVGKTGMATGPISTLRSARTESPRTRWPILTATCGTPSAWLTGPL